MTARCPLPDPVAGCRGHPPTPTSIRACYSRMAVAGGKEAAVAPPRQQF